MKNENLKRKNIITIRLTDLEYKNVVEYCKGLNISISDYFRFISLSFLAGGDLCAE